MYSQPDVVMVMLGTNDVWNGIPTAQIIAALSTLVDQMRAQKPTMRVLMARIPPMNPGGCSACDWPGASKALGDAIAAWVPTKSTSSSPVSVVDCYTGFVATDFVDGVHMTDSGNAKLAECWFEPVKSAVLALSNTGSETISSVITTTSRALSSTSTVLGITSSKLVASPSPTQAVTTTRSGSSTTLLTSTREVTTSSVNAVSAPLWGQCGKYFLC